MEVRKKVEDEFKSRANEDLVARADIVGLLSRLGLDKDDAEIFVDSWDVDRKPQVSYKGFLDFIYGPESAEGSSGVEKDDKLVKHFDLNGDGQLDSKDAEQAGAMLVDEARDAAAPPGEDEQPKVDEKQMTCSTILDASVGQESTLVTQSVGVGSNIAMDAEPSAGSKAPSEAPAGANEAENETSSKVVEDPLTMEPDPFLATPESVPTLPDASPPDRCSDCKAKTRIYQAPNYMDWYCDKCWNDHFDFPPATKSPLSPKHVVAVVTGRTWTETALQERWAAFPIYGWPPRAFRSVSVPGAGASFVAGEKRPKEVWSTVRVRVVPDLVGSHARESSRRDRPYLNEVLAGRYSIESVVGAGHFTRALLATDSETGTRVCIKRHNGLTIELLTDLLAIGERLAAVDPEAEYFPKLIETFYDMSGYTVETLIEGTNCLLLMREDPVHFTKMSNLHIVVQGTLKALAKLAEASVVHADVKSDNIMWTVCPTTQQPSVRLVDFGCARLDSRIENGRNWALNEGGAGHLGKWTPEMILRLPITCVSDVWGIAICALELHCGRAMWSCEADTVEVILAQILGLTNAREGLPTELLKRSPLDITKLYSPSPQYFPVRRTKKTFDAPLEELRPVTWGLECVLGKEDSWDETKIQFADYVKASLKLDHEERPSADSLLSHPFVLTSEPSERKEEDPQSKVRMESTACPEERPED